jgi:hypothetical protein
MKQKIRDRKKKLEQLEGQVSVERYEGVIRHNKRLDFTDDMNELATVQSHQDAAAQGEKMARPTTSMNTQRRRTFRTWQVTAGDRRRLTSFLRRLLRFHMKLLREKMNHP